MKTKKKRERQRGNDEMMNKNRIRRNFIYYMVCVYEYYAKEWGDSHWRRRYTKPQPNRQQQQRQRRRKVKKRRKTQQLRAASRVVHEFYAYDYDSIIK